MSHDVYSVFDADGKRIGDGLSRPAALLLWRQETDRQGVVAREEKDGPKEPGRSSKSAAMHSSMCGTVVAPARKGIR